MKPVQIWANPTELHLSPLPSGKRLFNGNSSLLKRSIKQGEHFTKEGELFIGKERFKPPWVAQSTLAKGLQNATFVQKKKKDNRNKSLKGRAGFPERYGWLSIITGLLDCCAFWPKGCSKSWICLIQEDGISLFHESQSNKRGTDFSVPKIGPLSSSLLFQHPDIRFLQTSNCFWWPGTALLRDFLTKE